MGPAGAAASRVDTSVVLEPEGGDHRRCRSGHFAPVQRRPERQLHPGGDPRGCGIHLVHRTRSPRVRFGRSHGDARRGTVSAGVFRRPEYVRPGVVRADEPVDHRHAAAGERGSPGQVRRPVDGWTRPGSTRWPPTCVQLCWMKLIVQPDAGIAPIVTAIKQAKRSVDILIFRLDRHEIARALQAAVARGVRVRALTAHQNRGGTKSLRKLEMELLEAGVTVSRTADALVRYHGKMVIVDNKSLHVYGFNFTGLDIEKSRSFGIVTKNEKLVN